MHGAIDTQKVRQLQDRFTKVTEYLGQYCEELKTDMHQMEATITEDRRQQHLLQQQAQANASSSSTDVAAYTTTAPSAPSRVRQQPITFNPAGTIPAPRDDRRELRQRSPLYLRSQAPWSTSRAPICPRVPGFNRFARHLHPT